jgi:hypothetical protein
MNSNNNSTILKCQGHHPYEGMLLFILAQVDAHRFCRRCTILLCFDCLLEKHSDHIEEAKWKIVDVLDWGKSEFKNFQTKVNDHLSKMVNCKNNLKADELKKKIEDNKIQRIKDYGAIQRKIDDFIEREKNLSLAAVSIIDKMALSEASSPEFLKVEESNFLLKN